MKLSERQKAIIEIVKENEPIIGDDIAKKLELSRATIRPDLTILTMLNILGARPKVGYFFTGKIPTNRFIDEVKEQKVRDYMSVPVILDEGSSIYEGIVTIFLEDTGTIFVTRDRELVGVVSRKDLLRSTIGQFEIEQTPLSVIMTRMPNIIKVDPDESIYEASRLLEKHGIDALPVVEEMDGQLRVIGRFTKTNILRIFVEWGEE